MNIRNNHQRVLPLAVVGVTLALYGCGGGNNGNPDGSAAISGKVLGSLVEGAIVCVDENENGRCDSTDSHRIFSSADGGFRIDKIPASLFAKPLVVEVPTTAMIVDPVSGAKSPVASEYRLSYPPSEADARFVSSLSTLVNSEFLNLGDVDDASESVADRLANNGITVNSSTLLDDYVARATAAGATADDISVYNVAKLAGKVMQVGQQGTAGDTAIDAAALMTLVAQKVFDTIDQIEQIARSNQAFINQNAADAYVAGIGQTSNLAIGAAEINRASQLAGIPYKLGKPGFANLYNFKEPNAAAEWRAVSVIRFKVPGGAAGRSIDEMKAEIPPGYQVGILDANGELQSTLGFHEPQWGDSADPKFWYSWQENDSELEVYTRQENGPGWPIGAYSFVLCPSGCASGEQISIGDDEIVDAPVGFGDFALLDDLVQEQLVFETSDNQAFRDGDEQMVFLSHPSPAHGTSYRFSLGIDDDADGSADEERSRSTIESMNRLAVPTGWIDEAHILGARVSHRDRINWEEISWEARSAYFPATINQKSSFGVDGIYDNWLADYSNEGVFREGFDASYRFYLAEGNPLVSLRFEDALGKTVVRLCLPDNIPSSQAELAVYEATHHGDGNEDYFDNCQNENLYLAFDLDSQEYAEIRLVGETSYNGDLEVLEAQFNLQQIDTDDTWGEAADQFDEMKFIIAEFEDGSSVSYPTDLADPVPQSFIPHGQPDVEICALNDDYLRVSWTPPDWLMDEYNAGELSVNWWIGPIDAGWDQLGQYRNRTHIGAQSSLLSRTFLQSLAAPGEQVEGYQVRVAFVDNDYYRWTHETFWAKVWRFFEAAEINSAPACV